MNTYQVRFWNSYKFDGSGKLILRMRYEDSTVIRAMNRASEHAAAWNSGVSPDDSNRVSLMTCEGWIRAAA